MHVARSACLKTDSNAKKEASGMVLAELSSWVSDDMLWKKRGATSDILKRFI